MAEPLAMFEWEEEFVKALSTENRKDKNQGRYKEVKKHLNGAADMWAALTASLEAETNNALSAAWPQLIVALDLNDAMHRHRVQGAVTRAFDSAVVSPMRKWIVEQVDFDPETMPDDDRPGQLERPDSRASRLGRESIESASTVGGTPREREPQKSDVAEYDRLLHCLNYLASRLYMRVKDVGHKDKGVEERIKKFEDHVAIQLTRGKREGPKEKKQRDDLNAERDALWQPVIRLADLLEPPVQRLVRAVEELGKARITEEAIRRIPDAVLWGACGWKLEAARSDVDALNGKWENFRASIEPHVWAALQDASVASALVRRTETGVAGVVETLPRIEGLLGASEKAFSVEAARVEVDKKDKEGRLRKSTSRLGGLSASLAGLSAQQIEDAKLVGKMLQDLDQRVTKITSSALWYVEEEVQRVRLSVPPPEPEHPWDQVDTPAALEELWTDKDLPSVLVAGAWAAADWEEGAHCAMQRLQRIAQRARKEAAVLDASVEPVADWLYVHADNALDVLDDASAAAAEEWTTAFVDGPVPDASAFAEAMRRTKPVPEGSMDIRGVYKQRACLRFLRGLYVLLTDADARVLAAGAIAAQCREPT